jgi:hypothetical protein
LVGIADAYYLAAVEHHSPGALNLEEEQIHCIVDPKDLVAGNAAFAGFDVLAGVVGHDAAAVNAPAKSQVLQFGIRFPQVYQEQVVRPCRKRESDTRRFAVGCHAWARSSRCGTFGRTVGVRHSVGREIGLEKRSASGSCIGALAETAILACSRAGGSSQKMW